MAEPTEPIGVLRVKRLELIDARGVVRATLGTTVEDGFDSVSLGLCDDRGYERVSLNVDGDAGALDLWHDGNVLATLRCARSGRASLVLSDEDGRPVTVVDNGEAA
jgi:hypothetical protein